MAVVAIILHVIGTVIGAGTVTANDLMFMGSIGDKDLGKGYQRMAPIFSLLIWLALALLIGTGTFFLIERPQILSSEKMLTKLGVVAIVAINGIIMNLLLHKKLEAITEKDWAEKSSRLKALVFMGLPFGVISVASWYTALILGAAGRQSWTFIQIAPLYLGAIIIGYILGRIYLGMKFKK